MKYHIDTIPIWDALKENSDCLLCALRRKTERGLLRHTLGASLMSPDKRVETNSTGFCQKHQVMLYSLHNGNRLGHALIMLSHLREIKPKVQFITLKAQNGKGTMRFMRFFRAKKRNPSLEYAGIKSPELVGNRCFLCDELKGHSDRQAASLLYLWKSDAGFRSEFIQSNGLCLADTAKLIAMAPEFLNEDLLTGFQAALQCMLDSSLSSLEADLAWYTQKFDYRNANEPWKNAKGALERTVNKLRGWCLGDEPMQDELP